VKKRKIRVSKAERLQYARLPSTKLLSLYAEGCQDGDKRKKRIVQHFLDKLDVLVFDPYDEGV
jgi:hypothetical protein